MQTRRELLQHSLLLPLIAAPQQARAIRSYEIISDSHLLSEESARGFGLVAHRVRCRVIAVCGAGSKAVARAPELRQRAASGEWIVWEALPSTSSTHRKIMHSVFGISVGATVTPNLYISYIHPRRALTRGFLLAYSVRCADSEVIAHDNGTPIAMKRRIGCGGIIFLGSMIGPNLYAEEPEAHAIMAGLVQTLESS
jgi:hypothetical protein